MARWQGLPSYIHLRTELELQQKQWNELGVVVPTRRRLRHHSLVFINRLALAIFGLVALVGIVVVGFWLGLFLLDKWQHFFGIVGLLPILASPVVGVFLIALLNKVSMYAELRLLDGDIAQILSPPLASFGGLTTPTALPVYRALALPSPKIALLPRPTDASAESPAEVPVAPMQAQDDV